MLLYPQYNISYRNQIRYVASTPRLSTYALTALTQVLSMLTLCKGAYYFLVFFRWIIEETSKGRFMKLRIVVVRQSGSS